MPPSDLPASKTHSNFVLEFLKWWQTIKVFWVNQLTYRMNFFLLVIGPSLVFYFVKYNLWSSVYIQTGSEVIEGYSLAEMLSYQAWVLVIYLTARGNTNVQLADDIRLGRISAYLIYPFDFWKFHAASFIGFVSLQSLISILTALLLWAVGLIPVLNLSDFLLGFSFSLFTGVFWFMTQFVIGLMAFWLEETWVFNVILRNVSQLLSGAMIPLELYPQWAREILAYSPFPYLTYVPVKIFMGDYEAIGEAYLYLSIWTLIGIFFGIFAWKKGMKLYSGAGM